MGENIFLRSPKSQRRVVVTGMSLLSPLGEGVKENWQAALEGKSGINQISSFDTNGFDVSIAGEIKNFDVDRFIPKKEQKKMDRFIHLSLAATELALQDSGIELTESLQERSGALIGVGIGGLPFIEVQHRVLMERGPSRLTPFFIPAVIANLAPGHISMKYGIKGPNFVLTSACASGAHAIGEAARYIRDGLCDMMIAGGAESAVSPMAVGGFAAMKALSTRNQRPQQASRPWDKDRDGFVLAEGSATLILEDYEHASRRGARIYAELTGYGNSSDAHHMTNPSPGGVGAARAMMAALQDASIDPDQVDYVNAHGTSTPAGDVVETEAMKRVFQEHAKKLWISSTKSMTGHALGAAGAIESVFSAMSVFTGKIPPTINLDNPSEDCDLDYVPHQAREKQVQHALNNSFGFGGTNATLVFSKLKE
ncbi:MAG: beta-ketoacyl-ACP synthase II [Bdellovibrionales bacterium]|nr:beta-ketoacyl-ACP synthase II [Bdellovibrionales bacterium]